MGPGWGLSGETAGRSYAILDGEGRSHWLRAVEARGKGP